MLTWWQKVLYYRKPAVLSVLFLGFSSGLPFLLTLATLHVWLSEAGACKTTIGLFVLVTLPYSFKFLWAPVIDHQPFPYLSKFFGKRKGWLIGSQLGIILCLISLGATNPESHISLTAFFAFGVAFFSATQDIVYEAFRIELLPKDLLGPGVGASSFGYRLGMWVAGAGSLYLASFISWFAVYSLMALCMTVGIVTILLTPEPEASSFSPSPTSYNTFFKNSFFSLLKQPSLKVVLGFIFLYKIGDTVLNTMTMPFLLEVGFSKLEIAHVAKSFGIFTMMIGGLVGGLYLINGSLFVILLVAICLQFLASLMFMGQAVVGYHLTLLFINMGIENFACGLGTAAFIVFLSTKCRQPFTATHFALLSSFGSLCRIFLSAVAGSAADHLNWIHFYGITACLTALGFGFIWLFKEQFQSPASSYQMASS